MSDSGMTLQELRTLNPKWTIERRGDGIHCRFGAFRVLASDPDDAEFEIATRERREPSPAAVRRPAGPYEPGTFGHMIDRLNSGSI